MLKVRLWHQTYKELAQRQDGGLVAGRWTSIETLEHDFWPRLSTDQGKKGSRSCAKHLKEQTGGPDSNTLMSVWSKRKCLPLEVSPRLISRQDFGKGAKAQMQASTMLCEQVDS